METVYIYTLSDPRTKSVRYVGSTVNLERRLVEHCLHPQTLPIKAWIETLRDEGHQPIAEMIDYTTEEEREMVERQWIRCYITLGAMLLNRVTTEAVKRKIYDTPLKRMRLHLRISQEDLAIKTGCDTNSIARYEAGKRTPTGSQLLCLMRELDLPAEALIVPARYLLDHPTFLPEYADPSPTRRGRPRTST